MQNQNQKIDVTDVKILRLVHIDKIVEPKMLQLKTKIPLSTLQRRLNKLRKSKMLTTRVDFSQSISPFPVRAMISIDVDPEMLHGKQSKSHGEFKPYSNQMELCNSLKLYQNASVLVESADVLLGGPSDIVAIIAAASRHSLLDFITNILRLLPGVKKTNTALMFATISDAKSIMGQHVDNEA
jgi:DNA-binding Lrp family transcriptional regulator